MSDREFARTLALAFVIVLMFVVTWAHQDSVEAAAKLRHEEVVREIRRERAMPRDAFHKIGTPEGNP
jgi:hypothetical protein